MAAVKLPTAKCGGLESLEWIVYAASKDDAEHQGVSVSTEKEGRFVAATDGRRIHVGVGDALVPHLPAGAFLPPGWKGVDWSAAAPWSARWRNLFDPRPPVKVGLIGRVELAYGVCRASIAYAQSAGVELPVVRLAERPFHARHAADALSGGGDDIFGSAFAIEELEEGYVLRVHHRCGEALVMALHLANPETELVRFDLDPFVNWTPFADFTSFGTDEGGADLKLGAEGASDE